MPLNPGRLSDENLVARVNLRDAEQTRALGRRFAAAIDPTEKTSIGFIAGTKTGKTTLASGIYEGLGSAHGSVHNMLVGMNGYCDTKLENSGLIRHFDLAVQPDDEDNIPYHWQLFGAGLQEAGVELVEHATRYQDERYSYIFKLDIDPDTKERIASVYAASGVTVDPALLEIPAADVI